MSPAPLHVAAISLHTSPLARPGSADAGGMNVVVLEEARALARLGHSVDLFTRRTGTAEPAVEDVSAGIRLIRLDAGPPRPLAKSDMEQAVAPFEVALRAHLAAHDDHYDVVHAHHWFSGVAALPVAREHGIPIVQSFHSVAAPSDASSLRAGEPAESGGRIAGERLTAQEADLVVAVSEAEARTVRERYEVPASRVAVVRPGVDTTVFHPAERPDLDGPPTLLFAARLQPLKAPDLAIEVLARLDATRGARLVLAGAASEDFAAYTDELHDLARALGVQDRVDVHGPASREELSELMRRATVLLLPSWSETFGLVALEAQASGTPVIAWRSAGGVAEAVGDGGIVLDSRDADVWAHATETILSDAAEHGRRSRLAREFATHRTWDASAEHLAEVYREVVAGRGAAPRAVLAGGTSADDPWSLLDGARTVLTVQAHPDDETLSTGPILAHLTLGGARVVLVTATRGEEGETIPGSRPDGDERPFEAVRSAELDAASSALGISERHTLGTPPALAPGAPERRYRDSGMRWVTPELAGPAEDTGPDAFTRRPVEDAVADLVALIDHVRPDVLVSYDDGGTYGHPDHVLVHTITSAAADRTSVPFVEVASYLDDDTPDPSFSWRDTPEAMEAVAAALAAHRTQLDVLGREEPGAGHPGGVRLRLSGGQEHLLPLRTGIRLREA